MRIKKIDTKERAQSIILITFIMAGVIAIMALAVDAGLIYNNRRKAQTAADAGALRGAREICDNPTATDAEIRVLVKDYAESKNEGDSNESNISINLINREVQVQTFINTQTFIASLIGRSSAEISATARAQCNFPSEVYGAAPIAWSCFSPPVGEMDTGMSPDCDGLDWINPEEEFGNANLEPWADQLDYLRLKGYYFDWGDYPDGPFVSNTDQLFIPDNLYIVMNDDVVCAPAGTIDCDPDEDGINEIIGSSARGWIDLDGGQGGANDLAKFITGEKTPSVLVHSWLPLITGTIGSLFNAAETIIGKVIILPVYDAVCHGDPEGSNCEALVHSGTVPEDEEYVYPNGNPNNKNFAHIIGFAPFYITCVKSGGNDECPGHSYLEEEGIINGNSAKTIEGFFIISNINNGNGSGGLNTGLYTVTLMLPIQ